MPPTPPSDILAQNDTRRCVLQRHGATPSDIDELLPYGANTFSWQESSSTLLPLPDDVSAQTWAGYVDAAVSGDALSTLQKHIVQLRFPVRPDIEKSEAYRRATRSLADTDVEAMPLVDGGVSLEAPSALRLQMTSTLAGRVPVIIAGSRSDFLTLYRAILKKNNPAVDILASVGAVMISGYSNWSRIHDVRLAGETAQRAGTSSLPWPERFISDPPPASQYKDRLILLSPSPYSGVPAQAMGLDEVTWAQQSVAIRAQHEAAHYVTRRLFGSMQNVLHDELIADYMGITAVRDTFSADWFLRFMGVEADRSFRPSGRLGAYRGTPALSDGAFEILMSLARAAARTIESVDQSWQRTSIRSFQRRTRMLFALTQVTVEELASAKGEDAIHEAEKRTRPWYRLPATESQ